MAASTPTAVCTLPLLRECLNALLSKACLEGQFRVTSTLGLGGHQAVAAVLQPRPLLHRHLSAQPYLPGFRKDS